MKFVASVLLFVALGGVGFCGQDAGSTGKRRHSKSPRSVMRQE